MKEEKKKTKTTKKNDVHEIVLESILDLNSNNVWQMDEVGVAQLWEQDSQDPDFHLSEEKLINTLRLAFEVVHYNDQNPLEAAKYENGGWEKIVHANTARGCAAIRRKTIDRITDLSYENIKHVTAPQLLNLIERNFGGGWDSIALGIKDIIQTCFDISTSQLPASRMHAPGGTLEKKVKQGFDVLEVAKGTWIEAIFAKKKEPMEKIRMELPDVQYDEDGNPIMSADNEDEENDDTFFGSFSPEAVVDVTDDEGFPVEDSEE